MSMTDAQRETVEMIHGTLPAFVPYYSGNGDVLLLDPVEPDDIIAINTDGSTNEFTSGEWRTGWEA